MNMQQNNTKATQPPNKLTTLPDSTTILQTRFKMDHCVKRQRQTQSQKFHLATVTSKTIWYVCVYPGGGAGGNRGRMRRLVT